MAQPTDIFQNHPFQNHPLVISPAVWNELEDHYLWLDQQIAACKGLKVCTVTYTRRRCLLLWEQWEGQWRASDTSSARRQALVRRKRARRRRWLQRRQQERRETIAPEFDCPSSAVFESNSVFESNALMDWLCRHRQAQERVMGWGMGLLAAYLLLTQLCPGWLAGILDFWKGY